MANSYFQFKQFRIDQDRCAMKVCTDSCILGAYAAVTGANKILDIGTGTGLLALMLAQRSNAAIDAVEIDREASEQACQNVLQSPFKDQITVLHTSIQAFSVSTTKQYDLIISNPPFFSNHLKRETLAQNIALHGQSLQLSELAIIASHLMYKAGTFIVMLPVYEMSILEEAASCVKLYPFQKLHILEKQNGRHIRVITSFSFTEGPSKEDTLYIKNEAGTYSKEFISLLKPYYLYM